MTSRLGDRLRAARHRHFVGRTDAIDLFRSTLESAELPYFVLHVYGPGGLGKTSLLREFADLCRQLDTAHLYVDARNLEPTPEAFVAALASELRVEDMSESALVDALSVRSQSQRQVIFLDTYEFLIALDDWLRDAFLPQMPENVLFVLAGRDRPTQGWRSDPGWQELLHTLPLRNLTVEDSADYLTRRHVPQAQQSAVIAFTFGHPLALSLVADVFDQRADLQFEPNAAIDVISLLVGRLLDTAPDAAHRATIEVCCLVRGTTEALLAELLQTPDAHELFQWLRGLSFVESGPRGLFPHDDARNVLHADLRWRNPDWYAELHRRARQYYIQRLQQTQGVEQQRALFDLIYLHRENPMVRPFFEWQTAARHVPDLLTDEDKPLLIEIVERHEGAESARIAGHWLKRQPQNFRVFRDLHGLPCGFLFLLNLNGVDEDDMRIDAAAAIVHGYLERHAPLRSGEVATLFRLWMAADTYQQVSPVQSLIFTVMVRHYIVTPGLAFTFLPCADPDFWTVGFEYADLARLPAVDYEIGGRRYGIYGHDWRQVSPINWLILMGDRELGMTPQEARTEAAPSLIVLSEPDFAQAVKDALRFLNRTNFLRKNPLVQSRMVMDCCAPDGDLQARVVMLQQILRDAMKTLEEAPRDLKFYRALYHTYIQPAPTQEMASELMDVPFSTYRRHLARGVERVVEQLWLSETGTPG